MPVPSGDIAWGWQLPAGSSGFRVVDPHHEPFTVASGSGWESLPGDAPALLHKYNSHPIAGLNGVLGGPQRCHGTTQSSAHAPQTPMVPLPTPSPDLTPQLPRPSPSLGALQLQEGLPDGDTDRGEGCSELLPAWRHPSRPAPAVAERAPSPSSPTAFFPPSLTAAFSFCSCSPLAPSTLPQRHT